MRGNPARGTTAWFISRGILEQECEAARALGLDAVQVSWNDVSLPLTTIPDVARWMLDPSIDFAFQLSCMEELERSGVRVINPPAAVMLCDKASIYILWTRHLKGMTACPCTLVTSNLQRALEFIYALDSAVIKPVQGQGGAGVMLVARDGPGLEKAVRDALARHGAVVVQEHVPNLGWELRTIVIGDEIAAQFARVGSGSTFKHGLGSNGLVARVDDPRINVPERHLADAGRVAFMVKKVTGLDMFAIDMLIGTDNKLYLLEWNPFFGYGAVGDLGYDLATRVASYISRA